MNALMPCASLFVLQHEKELLRDLDDQKRLLEEAQEKCVVEENKLYHLQRQINNARKQVTRAPVFIDLLSAGKAIKIKKILSNH